MYEIRSVIDGLHDRHRALRDETATTPPRCPGRALPLGATRRED